MRIRAVFKPSDFQPTPDASRADAEALFEQMFPGVENPEIPRDHAGMAIVALNPGLARHMSAMSRFMALELAFSKRRDLRELAIQTCHLKAGCGFGFESRISAAGAAGISPDQLAALAVWKSSSLFDDEQRLVIEYAEAVHDNAVTDELFQAMVERFGEKGAIECAAIVGYWACWAMIINAAKP